MVQPQQGTSGANEKCRADGSVRTVRFPPSFTDDGGRKKTVCTNVQAVSSQYSRITALTLPISCASRPSIGV